MPSGTAGFQLPIENWTGDPLDPRLIDVTPVGKVTVYVGPAPPATVAHAGVVVFQGRPGPAMVYVPLLGSEPKTVEDTLSVAVPPLVPLGLER